MSFKGRYYTDNGKVVAVHPKEVKEEITGYFGHIITLEAPFEIKDMFEWNSKGYCTSHNGENVEILKGYDLVRMVNPQTYPAQIETVGCAECAIERKEKLENAIPQG